MQGDIACDDNYLPIREYSQARIALSGYVHKITSKTNYSTTIQELTWGNQESSSTEWRNVAHSQTLALFP